MNKNKWFLNGGRGSGKTFRLICEAYENKIADLKEEINKIAFVRGNLEEENKELQDKLEMGIALKDEEIGCIQTDFNTFKSEAKEIIKKLIEAIHIWDCKNLEQVEAEAEQFLNSEVEK